MCIRDSLKQEQAMRFYYPDMIAAIDLKREDTRLSQIEFVSQAPVRQVKVVEPPRPPEPKGCLLYTSRCV